MAFQVSPGVQVKEIDATGVVPAVSTSIGGFAGSFNWGPVDKVSLVSSEKELAEKFGSPDSNTAKYFLVAASFLKYGNALKVVRVASGHDNATADGTGQLIKNDDDYDNNYADGSLSKGNWVAKYPGELGNSIKVGLITANVSNFDTIEYLSGKKYSDIFDAVPKTSQYALDLGKASTLHDEMHIVVVDEDGAISGTPGEVLEKFEFVSQGSDAKKSDGTTNFYKEVINSQSEYIWWADHPTSLSDAGETIASNTAFTTSTSAIEDSLAGGSDDNAPTVGEIQSGFDLLEDAETEDVNLLFAAPDANGANTIANDLLSIAIARKDCMAFVSPPIEETVGESDPATAVKAFADSLT